MHRRILHARRAARRGARPRAGRGRGQDPRRRVDQRPRLDRRQRRRRPGRGVRDRPAHRRRRTASRCCPPTWSRCRARRSTSRSGSGSTSGPTAIIDGSRNAQAHGRGLLAGRRGAREADGQGGRVDGRRAPQRQPALLARPAQRRRSSRADDRRGAGARRSGARRRLPRARRGVREGGRGGVEPRTRRSRRAAGEGDPHLPPLVGLLRATRSGSRSRATVEPVPGHPADRRSTSPSWSRSSRRARCRCCSRSRTSRTTPAGSWRARPGMRVVVASPSCDAPAAGSYLAHFDAADARRWPQDART